MDRLQLLRGFNRVAGRVAPDWNAKLADRYLWRPRRHPPRDWEREAEAGARRVTLRFGLSALRWGDAGGAIVLMLHGWEGRPTQFAALLPRLLSAGRQVIALDGPAHGRSPGREATPVSFAAALLEAADEIGPLDAVVGHSMGAAAAGWALAQGLRARRAVLISGPSAMTRVLQRDAAALGLTAAAAARLLRVVERRTGVAPEALDIAQAGRRLQLPALIVHDRDDALVPHAEGEATARAWRGAELLSTTGLGHWRVLKDGAVVQRIGGFLLDLPRT